MARTVDYSKKAEKIKEQVDELVQELMAAKSAPVVSKRSLKVADINFENEEKKLIFENLINNMYGTNTPNES